MSDVITVFNYWKPQKFRLSQILERAAQAKFLLFFYAFQLASEGDWAALDMNPYEALPRPFFSM